MDNFTASEHFRRLNSRNDKCHFKGPFRVFRLCLLGILLPTLLVAVPLYLKYRVFSEEIIPLGMSDMRLLSNKISTTWCQRQLILSNATFNAYLLPDKPTPKREPHMVSLVREIILKDDMKEYWGFYLLKGSTVTVSMCTRRFGTSLIVLRGHKHLQQCAYFGDTSSEEEEEREEVDNKTISIFRDTKRARPGVVFHGDVDFHERNLFSKELDTAHAEDPLVQSRKMPNRLNDAYDNSHEQFLKKTSPSSSPSSSKEVIETLLNVLQNYNKSPDKKEKTRILEWLKGANFANDTRETTVPKNKRDLRLWSELNTHDEQNNDALEEGVEHDEIQGRFYDGTSNDTSNSEFWSSFSSSEERLLECDGLVLNLPLRPSHLCNKSLSSETVHHVCQSQKISYKVPSNGYYFFIFSSENEIQSTYVRAHFELEKVIYNVSQPVASCENSTGQCALPLNFFSKEQLVLELPINDSLWNTEFVVISSCEPRTLLYAACVLAVPFLILLCAF